MDIAKTATHCIKQLLHCMMSHQCMHPLLLLSKGLLIEGASAMPMISNTLPFGGAGWYGVITMAVVLLWGKAMQI